MDLNLIVAASVLTLTAILIIRYAMRLGALFLMGGLFLFLIGFISKPGSTSTNSDEHAVALPDNKEAEEITLPPSFIRPDQVRIGLPPRVHKFEDN